MNVSFLYACVCIYKCECVCMLIYLRGSCIYIHKLPIGSKLVNFSTKALDNAAVLWINDIFKKSARKSAFSAFT